MIKVYVAGPYSADNVLDVLNNIKNGVEAATRLFETGIYAPFCPWADHLYVLHGTKVVPKGHYYQASLAFLKVCDAVLLTGDWRKSKGTLAEIEEARRLEIPVFESFEDLDSWAMTERNTEWELGVA